MAFVAGVNLHRRRALADRRIGANTRSVTKDGQEQNHASDAMEGGSHAGTLSWSLLGLAGLDSRGEHSAQLRMRSYHTRRSVVHPLDWRRGELLAWNEQTFVLGGDIIMSQWPAGVLVQRYWTPVYWSTDS